jgi:Pyridoxamine 5'-phosphate oxidase
MILATDENGWVGQDASAQHKLSTQAVQILENTLYCTLATCSPAGMPWATPLFFIWDSQWHLYWSSAIASQHSQNLLANAGKASIAIYSTQAAQSGVQGLFLAGVAQAISGDLSDQPLCDRIERIINQMFDRARGPRPQRTAADYLGESSRRIYHFTPEQAWITGERIQVDNQLVDTKLQLDLPKA